MKTSKIYIFIVIAIFSLFLTTGVQAGIVTQTLGGDVDQGVFSTLITGVVGAGDEGNALVDYDGNVLNKSQFIGTIDISGSPLLLNPVYYGEDMAINQNTGNFPIEQGPEALTTRLYADNDGTGNATVGGGFVYTNIFNSVVVGSTVPALITIRQPLGSSSIEQGINQIAEAQATSGNAVATGILQKSVNQLNIGLGATADTDIDVIQLAGGSDSVEQDSANTVIANTLAGEASANGSQYIQNVVNLAGSAAGLVVEQTTIADGVDQEANNTVTASSAAGPAVPPLSGPADPAIDMDQTALNYTNRIYLFKTSGQASLEGFQSFNTDTPIVTEGTNILTATMTADGNASITGSQTTEHQINYVSIASGGADVPAGTFVQSTTGAFTMNNGGTPSNSATATVGGDGNASINDLQQTAVAYLNVIDTSGPLSGNFSQTTGGATVQAFTNSMTASTVGDGNVSITGGQTVTNAINVIQ